MIDKLFLLIKINTVSGRVQEESGKMMNVHYPHISCYARNHSVPRLIPEKTGKNFLASADYLLLVDIEKNGIEEYPRSQFALPVPEA